MNFTDECDSFGRYKMHCAFERGSAVKYAISPGTNRLFFMVTTIAKSPFVRHFGDRTIQCRLNT